MEVVAGASILSSKSVSHAGDLGIVWCIRLETDVVRTLCAIRVVICTVRHGVRVAEGVVLPSERTGPDGVGRLS